jgi:accessory gene regulator B
MAEKMAFFLVRKEIVGAEKSEICSFGLEILFATAINGILVVTASLVLGVFWQTVLMLAPFVLIRNNAGGFHAKTHVGCMLGFLTVYIAGVIAMSSVSLDTAQTVMFISLPIAASVILIIGALPHKNRPVSSRELARFKIKARLLSCGLSIIGFIGLYTTPAWFIYFTLGMVIAAGSLLAGCIQIKRGKGCD